MGSYRDLAVWEKGIALAKAIYELTATFPADERFGLTNLLMKPERRMMKSAK